MVAEPVQATVQALDYYYNVASKFVSKQVEQLPEFDLLHLNPVQTHMESNVNHDSVIKRISNNKGIISVLTVGIGAGIWYYGNSQVVGGSSGIFGSNWRHWLVSKPVKKRRVPKLANGARQDVVLIVGSPTEPLTRLIALDFERRGFIVYLTILDETDMKYTETNTITEDINYLNLVNSFSFDRQLNEFHQLLRIPIVPFPGASPHSLKLVGVVFTPHLHYPIGPVENVTVASWTKILDRLSVYPKLFSSGLIQLIRLQKAKTILITPCITSTLNLPYHGPESLLQNALQSLFSTITKEIRQHQLCVTQIKLGNISVLANGNSISKKRSIINSEINGWNDDIRTLYSKSFSNTENKSIPMQLLLKGTNLRALYHLLYDLIYSKTPNPPVTYFGTGARMYEWIYCLLPSSFLLWVLS